MWNFYLNFESIVLDFFLSSLRNVIDQKRTLKKSTNDILLIVCYHKSPQFFERLTNFRRLTTSFLNSYSYSSYYNSPADSRNCLVGWLTTVWLTTVWCDIQVLAVKRQFMDTNFVWEMALFLPIQHFIQEIYKKKLQSNDLNRTARASNV